MTPSLDSPPRELLLKRGLRLEIFTIAWNVLEGLIALTAGALAGSVALVGFGLDSFVETTSALVVGWRLREELRGRPAREAERLERKAARIAGALLLVLAAYVVLHAGAQLFGMGERPEESRLGIAITALSLVVMPILARAKLGIARELGSRALRADAYETIGCVWLSLTTLVGLVANAALGWAWADPLAAMFLVPLLAREGLESWRGEGELGDNGGHGEEDTDRSAREGAP